MVCVSLFYEQINFNINPHLKFLQSVGWDSGEGIMSHATCCSSSNTAIDIECEAVWSPLTDTRYITVGCPDTDQFMTSCSGAYVYKEYSICSFVFRF